MSTKNSTQLLVYTDRSVVKTFFCENRAFKHFQILIDSVSNNTTPLRSKIDMVSAILIDVSPDIQSSIQITKEIKMLYPCLPIVGMICCSRHIAAMHLQALVSAGVTSLLNLHLPDKELFSSIQQVVRGHIVIQVELTKDHRSSLSNVFGPVEENKTNTNIFSEDNIRLLRFIASGLSDREIADKISTSPSTVHHYIQRLCRDTVARNRTELAAKAASWGLY